MLCGRKECLKRYRAKEPVTQFAASVSNSVVTASRRRYKQWSQLRDERRAREKNRANEAWSEKDLEAIYRQRVEDEEKEVEAMRQRKVEEKREEAERQKREAVAFKKKAKEADRVFKKLCRVQRAQTKIRLRNSHTTMKVVERAVARGAHDVHEERRHLMAVRSYETGIRMRRIS